MFFKTCCTVCKVTSGNYKLVGDISLSRPLCIEAGSTVTFILDGYKISRGGGTSQAQKGMVICNFGELTLGSQSSNSGIITGGSAANGGGVYVCGEDAIFTNYVTITDNYAGSGGGVYVTGGAVFTNKGTISNATSGGGIYNDGSTVVNEGITVFTQILLPRIHQVKLSDRLRIPNRERLCIQ